MKAGRKTVPIALTVAGSDSGGGAGIQADLKTFAAREVWGLTAITLVTAQNTAGVIDIHFLPTDVVSSQLMVLNDDFDISAAKTGALGTADLILLVAKWFDAHPVPWLIVDPVAVSKHNDNHKGDNETVNSGCLCQCTTKKKGFADFAFCFRLSCDCIYCFTCCQTDSQSCSDTC